MVDTESSIDRVEVVDKTAVRRGINVSYLPVSPIALTQEEDPVDPHLHYIHHLGHLGARLSEQPVQDDLLDLRACRLQDRRDEHHQKQRCLLIPGHVS